MLLETKKNTIGNVQALDEGRWLSRTRKIISTTSNEMWKTNNLLLATGTNKITKKIHRKSFFYFHFQPRERRKVSQILHDQKSCFQL